MLRRLGELCQADFIVHRGGVGCVRACICSGLMMGELGIGWDMVMQERIVPGAVCCVLSGYCDFMVFWVGFTYTHCKIKILEKLVKLAD